MAEIKNSFLKSKMNKDLDDRLIHNGEYRDAQNISVGKSEADDIGALETVLGNVISTDFGLTPDNLDIIGYKSIDNDNRIIVFLTNYNDTSTNPVLAASTDNCYIYEFTPPGSFDLLVSGYFLNFSKNKPITGISVIENLLFWTDNRNQPRKINIETAKANSNYYSTESDISVAKYNPYQVINILNKVNTTTTTTGSSSTLTVASTVNIEKGMAVVEYGNTTIAPEDYIYVVNINGASTFGSLVGGTGYPNGSTTGVATTVSPAGGTGLTVDITVVAGIITVVAIANPGDGYSVNDVITITGGNGDATITLTAISNIILNATVSGLTSGDTIYFLSTTMTGENITYNFNDGDPTSWPGDPDYLEDKFVRFSYRFEFDDGEYSLMAPFTQIGFIPKQKGYFLSGDENEVYRSTVVEFMENGVQDIELHIPFPDTLDNVGITSTDIYKIKSLDILYKESDGLSVKVLDTIMSNAFSNQADSATSIIYKYDYQSRKPFRTLPQVQTTRVYDKVPVKALAQETSGNRIIYGNFYDKYTPPTYLDYKVGIGPKSLLLNYDNWSEYPHHSVKQNRNYQVGFVLADKFGRQSDVILSSEIATTTTELASGIIYGGDTIFSPYNDLNENTNNPIRDWFGDALKIDISSEISSGTSSGTPNITTGEPGLYANSRGNGFNTAGVTPVITTTAPFTYTFTLNAAGPNDIPIEGSYLRGQFKDFVEVITRTGTNPYVVTCDGAINTDIYSLRDPAVNPDNKMSYTINPIGWYSYKIVVKQQEQDYYNVYLPGILKGYPDQETTVPTPNPFNIPAPTFPSDPPGSTSNVVLINDNINKIPRDLSEVGPDQKQFRSSVQLFGRVENDGTATNEQFYPGILSDTAISISTADDANMVYQTLDSNGQSNLYQIDTNPLIARISTTQAIGVVTASMEPYLAIYETEPQESLLDIFWETSTVGLIADLNSSILNTFTGAVGWQTYNWNQLESAAASDFITGLQPIDSDGNVLNNTSLSNFSAVDINGTGVNISYTRTGSGTGGDPHKYNFKTTSGDFVYNETENIRNYVLSMVIKNLTTNQDSTTLNLNGGLTNVVPAITTTINPITNNMGTSGIIATYAGVNGALDSVKKLQELKWSVSGTNVAGNFTMNAVTGELTQSGSAPSGVYSLTIKLEDANGNLANGSLSVTDTQGVTIQNVTVGYLFYAGPSGNLNQACPAFGAQAPDCGTEVYYSQSALVGGYPPAGAEIRTGPNGTGSPLATQGWYSLNCDTGAARYYMHIDNINGLVASGSPASCGA